MSDQSQGGNIGRELSEGTHNTAQASETIPDYWIDFFSNCETECEPEPDCWEVGSRQKLSLSVPVDEGSMTELCRAVESTPHAFFTAAFAYLCAVFTGREDVLFRTIASKEKGKGVIPFRLNLKNLDNVVELIQQAESGLQQGNMHDVPKYAELADALGLNLPLLFCYGTKPADESGVVFTQGLPSNGVCHVELQFNNGKYSVDWAESFTNTCAAAIPRPT